MKICVYAIAKNESKFITRWYESVKEADYVCVLDTGSSDDTYEKLKSLNIITEQKTYKSFRFDQARNDSLKLIPNDTDICVCIDLDEFFEPGWSEILKENWTPNTVRARYRYTWNFNEDGSEGVVFMLDKIHKKDCFTWIYPVHEVLKQTRDFLGSTIDLPQIQLNHRADNTKPRSSYLPLLELSVKENPSDDRNIHYLGREYMFYGQYKKAISTLQKHLNLPTATWDAERSASLRYIANCYKQLNKPNKQIEYLLKAILECNYIREPYYELAVLYFNKKDYLKSAFYFNEMFKIKDRALNYMSSPICWGSLPYDYLSLCYYHLKEYKKAITTIDIALSLNPESRLLANKEFFIKALEQQQQQQ